MKHGLLPVGSLFNRKLRTRMPVMKMLMSEELEICRNLKKQIKLYKKTRYVLGFWELSLLYEYGTVNVSDGYQRLQTAMLS